ncbi:hypothetical protein [Paraconexibacter sp.]|uniref:hypothetical protein n=1 Tax=Paraconexibacter sp. TaxID=2949640 RepID=UPI003564769B
MSTTRTYRGRGLDELLERIKAELGPDAVIVAQREDVEGGVGGFFAKRVIEVDARPGGATLDIVADEPAAPEPISGPAAAPALYGYGGAPGPSGLDTPEDGTAEPTFEEHLKALLGAAGQIAPPAPAVRPVIAPQVDEAPAPEPLDIANVARAFSEAPIVEDVEAPADVDPPAATTPAEPSTAAAPPTAAEPPTAPEAPTSAEPPTASEPEPDPDPTPEPPAAAAPARPTPPDPAPGAVTRTEPPARALTSPAPTPVTDRDSAWEALVEAGIGATLAADIVEETVTHLLPFAEEPSLKPLVHRALASRIPVHATRGAAGHVIGFVGPGGSGKTHCAARLAAAYAARTSTPVACVTVRAKDGGSELRDMLTGSGVEVHAEPDADAASRRIERLRQTALVILDTPAVSPRADAELRVLAAELAQLRADEVHLTMPATIGPRPARDLVAAGRRLGTCAIAITHSDETDALGTPVDVAIDTGLPISFVGRGHAPRSGLIPADAHDLATTLIAA